VASRIVASNSRRNVGKAALLTLLGLSGAAALRELAREGSPRTGGSRHRARLWVRESGPGGGDDSELAQAESDSLARTAWLCATTLPNHALLRILEDVGRALDSLEARANPFAIDLSDEDVAAIERRVSREILPIWNAARALSAPSWRTGDGAFRVAIESAAVTPPFGVTPFELWSNATITSMPASARFAAWALTGSRLRVVDSNRKAALRERALQPDSAVALVVDASVLDVSIETMSSRAVESLAELRDRVSRLEPTRLPHVGATAEILRAFAGGLPPAPLFGWLALEPEEVLVVPKLRFAARPDRLDQELDEP
jgi:hypothetical protein